MAVSVDQLRDEVNFDVMALNELQLALYVFQEAVLILTEFQLSCDLHICLTWNILIREEMKKSWVRQMCCLSLQVNLTLYFW